MAAPPASSADTHKLTIDIGDALFAFEGPATQIPAYLRAFQELALLLAPPTTKGSPPPIFYTLQANRSKYPTPMSNDQIGMLLNETAWYHVREGWGMIEKPSGSNCRQPVTGTLMARDILANKFQQILVDVLIDAEGAGTPSWGTEKPLDKPFLAPVDAGSGPPPPIPNPPSDGAIPYNEAYAVQFGQGCNSVYQEAGPSVTVDPGMICVHGTRAAWDYYVGGMTWDASYKKHINEFRAEYGLPPV